MRAWRIVNLEILHNFFDCNFTQCSDSVTINLLFKKVLRLQYQLFFHILSFPVPSGAPGKVAAITVAPTSVNVSWNQLPNTSRNGIIIAYEVAYTWSLGNGQLATNSVNTSGAQNQLMLNMLQECVQYSISVRAYTSQGPGPYSVPVLDSSLNSEFNIVTAM